MVEGSGLMRERAKERERERERKRKKKREALIPSSRIPLHALTAKTRAENNTQEKIGVIRLCPPPR